MYIFKQSFLAEERLIRDALSEIHHQRYSND